MPLADTGSIKLLSNPRENKDDDDDDMSNLCYTLSFDIEWWKLGIEQCT